DKSTLSSRKTRYTPVELPVHELFLPSITLFRRRSRTGFDFRCRTRAFYFTINHHRSGQESGSRSWHHTGATARARYGTDPLGPQVSTACPAYSGGCQLCTFRLCDGSAADDGYTQCRSNLTGCRLRPAGTVGAISPGIPFDGCLGL